MDVLVDGADHVYIPMVGAAEVFPALSEQLELPVLWPFGSFGEFSSGGVSLVGPGGPTCSSGISSALLPAHSCATTSRPSHGTSSTAVGCSPSATGAASA